VEWQPRQRIVLDRHEEYWGQRPHVDRVILRPIPDPSVRMTALRAGDVDMAEKAPYEWVRQIADGRVEGVRTVEGPHGLLRLILFNVADPPFDDRRLREAVAHAIDKEEILHAAYFGFGRAADQKYPPGHAWHIEGIPARPRDLERARALLQEAGYRGEPIGILVSQGAFRESEATTLQAQLRRIGMNVRLDVLEAGAYTDRQRKGEFAFMVYGGSFVPDPWSTYGTDLLCEEASRRGENIAGYCDEEMDALLRQAEAEQGLERRRELFRAILTRIARDLPHLYLGFVPEYYALRDPVRGFSTNGLGHFMHYGGGLNYTWLDR
jgi:peptide/nickel transport system substrate-binding protein